MHGDFGFSLWGLAIGIVGGFVVCLSTAFPVARQKIIEIAGVFLFLVAIVLCILGLR